MTDSVWVYGGINNSSAVRMSLLAVTHQHNMDWTHGDADGVIGFSFKNGARTWFEQSYFQGQFAKGIFSLSLGAGNGTGAGSGVDAELAFGGVNPKRFSGSIG